MELRNFIESMVLLGKDVYNEQPMPQERFNTYIDGICDTLATMQQMLFKEEYTDTFHPMIELIKHLKVYKTMRPPTNPEEYDVKSIFEYVKKINGKKKSSNKSDKANDGFIDFNSEDPNHNHIETMRSILSH